MALVQDLTYDDKNMTAPPQVAGGQPFVKGWRVRNTGTCPWDNTYQFVHVRGNVSAARMSGEPVVIARTVPSRGTYDIQVNLVAPTTPGIYQGFWQMRNGKGVAFGHTIWVGITVPGEPTATPVPTQTPSPGIYFSADRIYIKAGERVIFTWDVVNIKAVYFYAEGEPWEKNGVTGEGKREVYPERTTTYNLRVVKRDDSVEVRHIRIEVEPVVGAPIINRFTLNPEFQITVGQCVDILWQVQGDVHRVNLLRNSVALWDGAPISGSIQDCPPGTGEMAYVIEASGPGGTSRLQRVVNVVRPTATPVPATPTPTEPPPTSTPTPTELPPTATPTPTEPSAANPLAGTSWQMTSYYNGQAMVSALVGTEVTVFFGDDGSVSGSAGCNTYSASYTVDGNSLSVGVPVATKMVCDVEIMAQENIFLADLMSSVGYEISGDTLSTWDETGQKVLEFTRQ